MPPHCQLIKLISRSGDNQPQANLRRLRVSLIWALVGSVILACGGLGTRTGADRVTILTQLPTLTRTPLPTLTPTVNATQPAMVMVAETTTDSATNRSDLPLLPTSEMPETIPTPSVETLFQDNSANNAALTGNTISTTIGEPSPPAAAPVTTPPTPPATATPSPTNPVLPTATEVPPTPTETPTPSPTPLPAGWVFADVKLRPDPDGRDLLILGNLINNTGTSQILDTIDGLFYDGHGQPIDNIFYTLDYPINEVPQGGQIPFQIQLKDQPNAADFELQVMAESGGDTPRQDFEFLEINASPQGDDYCLAGKVRNPGGELANYLLVAAVLYDGENKVINYNYDYFDEALLALVGEQTHDVALCVDPLQQEVARYEFEAWGL